MSVPALQNTADERNAAQFAVSLLGDAWTLLIIREAFQGAHRYSEWSKRLDISELVLADRLKRLVSCGILEHGRASEGTVNEYRLTDCGKDLWLLLLAMWRWQVQYPAPAARHKTQLVHTPCQTVVMPTWRCSHCDAEVTPQETRLSQRAPHAAADIPDTPHYRRSRAAPRERNPDFSRPLMALIGDQASARILAALFQGAHGFEALERELGLPPALLSNRVTIFRKLGVITAAPHRDNARRKFYRLTQKGLALYPIVIAIVAWGAQWFGPRRGASQIIHAPCGKPLATYYRCECCRKPLERRSVRFEAVPA